MACVLCQMLNKTNHNMRQRKTGNSTKVLNGMETAS